MILLVDVGNSRFKFAQYQQQQLTYAEPIIHQQIEPEKILTQAWAHLSKPKNIIIACVAKSEWRENLSRWCAEHWEIKPVFLQAAPELLNVKNAYQDASTLGVDRWLAMVAAFHQFNTLLCVISLGTFITVDVVDQQGHHLGGMIAPNDFMLKQAISWQTDGKITISQDAKAIPTLLANNTADGIATGCQFMLQTFLTATAEHLQQQFNQPISIILTGGGAQYMFDTDLKNSLIKPNLVLEGMALWCDANHIHR